MNLAYDVLVRHEVYLALKEIRSTAARTRLLEFMARLSRDPFHSGDSFLVDERGRRHHFQIIGKVALVYWADHVEKEIRVVDLIDADQLP